MENISSEQELKHLLEDGKITQAEYEQLLEAMRKPKPEALPSAAKSELAMLRRRLLTFGFVGSIIGLPAGIILGLPYVWGLSIIGIIVGLIKLKKLAGN